MIQRILNEKKQYDHNKSNRTTHAKAVDLRDRSIRASDNPTVAESVRDDRSE